MQKEKSDFLELENLRKEIYILNERLTKVEASLDKMKIPDIQLDKNEINQPEEEFEFNLPFQSEGSIEFRVGEYGMAWLGNIVLLIGILFLTQFLQKNGQETFSLVFGFLAVAGIYLAGYYTKRPFPYMSQLFTYNGHIMLYIISMRIYLFSGSRLTENALIGYGIVLLVIGAFIYLAFRYKSQVMAIMVWLMAVITALLSNSTHLMLSLMLVITGSSIFFTIRRGWWIGMLTSII